MKTGWFLSPSIDTVDADVLYFQSTVDFPSWTSRVRVPSPAPCFQGLASTNRTIWNTKTRLNEVEKEQNLTRSLPTARLNASAFWLAFAVCIRMLEALGNQSRWALCPKQSRLRDIERTTRTVGCRTTLQGVRLAFEPNDPVKRMRCTAERAYFQCDWVFGQYGVRWMFTCLAEEGRITLPLQETNPRIRIGTPKTAGFSAPSPKFTWQKVRRMRGVALPLAAAPPPVLGS